MSPTNDLEDPTPPRSRRPLVIVAILAALVVAGVAIVYVSFFTDDAPPPLALSDQSAATPTTAPAAGSGASTGTTPASTEIAGVWKVVTGSVARYRVREKLAALPAKSDAVGSTPAVSGMVKVEGAGAALTATAASFEVDLTKLESNEDRRDNRIRTDGLQTNQFPKATFVATAPITLPADTRAGEAVRASAEGDLTLHGVTKRVTIPLEIRVTGGKGELVGSLGFPMSDFAITPPSIGGFVTVDADATLEFKLLLEKA